MHYNEFQAVKLARQLIEDDEDDRDDDSTDRHIAGASGDQPAPHATLTAETSDSVLHTGDTDAAVHMPREDLV